MRRGLNSQAYTIVEVMIVLVVSSALLVSALLFVGGQQRKTEFYQSIHDIEQQINDVMNNVSTGYYAKTAKIDCDVSVTGEVVITEPATDNPQGSNQDCIFIGRAIQFGVSGSDGKGFNVYNLAGLRNKHGTDIPAQDFIEVKPKAIAKTLATDLTTPDSSEKKTLKYGLSVTKMYYDGDTANNTGIVAFISNLKSYDTTNNKMISGSQTVSLYRLDTSSILTQSSYDAVSIINTPTKIKEANSVTICFASGGTDQYGVITIGGDNRQLSTKLDIMSTAEATTGSGPCI